MKKNQFTQEQKYIILESAGKIGIKESDFQNKKD